MEQILNNKKDKNVFGTYNQWLCILCRDSIGSHFLISGKWKTNEYITGKRRIDNENGI
jgi:hypothetical protein